MGNQIFCDGNAFKLKSHWSVFIKRTFLNWKNSFKYQIELLSEMALPIVNKNEKKKN